MNCLSAFTQNTSGVSTDYLLPSGLKVIVSGLRCVILIHAESQIRTLKFEDIAAAVEGNLGYQKAYDYNFTDPVSIRNIISSSGNTFGLLKDGRIFYFVSFRAVEIIPNVKNVRAICDTDNGFALIRNSSATQIFIEFYTDRSSSEMLKKYKKIPIGWDEKWKFARDQEKSVLHTLRLDSDRIIELFGQFIDEEEEENEHGGYSKAVVFSINCSLFCIFYENAKDVQSGVNSIRTFLSEVQSVQIFSSIGVMCVLLATGVIHVLYVDQENGDLKEDTIFLGLEEVEAVESIVEDNCLYISDRKELIKLTFQLNSKDEQKVTWSVERKELIGVVGISYVPSIKAVLLITENYFIYSIEHKIIADISDSLRLVSEVTPTVDELQENLLALSTASNCLAEEYSKSTAINIMLNPHVIRDNCKVILSFKSYVDYNVMPALMDKIGDQMYDINLEFQFNSELRTIFKSGKWTLTIFVRRGTSDDDHQETIQLDDVFLKHRRVTVLRSCSRNTETIGADFDVAIQGFVSSAEKLLIKVPLKVAHNIESVVEVLEEDPYEMTGKWKFTIQTEDRTIINKLLDLIIAQRMAMEPFVIGIGQSAIIVNIEELSCTFMSNDQSALHMLKKMLLIEGHEREIWSRISYEPKETIALCELSARHALFGDDAVQETLKEVYKDIRDCIIKLS